MNRRAAVISGLAALALLACTVQPAPPGNTAGATPLPTAAATAAATPFATLVAPTPVATAAAPAPTTTPALPRPTPVTVLNGHTGSVTSLAWSPDGVTLASASGGFNAFQSTDLGVRLWTTDGTLRASLSGHAKPVSALAWSPDGGTLASASYDGTVRLWNPEGKAIRTLPVAEGSVHSIAWSPDGRILAIGALTSLAPAPGGNVVLPGLVELWRPDGTRVRSLHTQFSGGKFFNLAWFPDGSMLAGGATDYHIWRADGTELASTQGCNSCTPAWAMSWLPNNRALAIGNENGDLFVYDAAGKTIASFHFSGGVDFLAVSPDGNQLVVASRRSGLRLLNTGNLQESPRSLESTSTEAAAVWAPDGTVFAAGTASASARVWRADGKLISILDGCGTLYALAWLPGHRTLAGGSKDNRICLWQVPA